jgi:ubiquinone/menaquinone biosynthesis C-methylase UbiE
VLVHANDYNTMWIALGARFLCGSRVVYDCHEHGRPEWRPWLLISEWLFVRLADAVVTTSPGYAAEMSRRYRVPPPAVVRNIPENSTSSQSHDPDLGLAVYVGGLMPGRGLEPAIRALALLPSLRLRLLGPARDEYRRHLGQLAVQVGVTDRVEFAGTVPPDQVVGAVSGAGLGLMLIEPVCRSYELTLPNKLFEYAVAGVPILASDLEVIGSIVGEGGLGDVAAPDRPEEIATALERLSDPAANAAARERLRQFAAENTWTRERALLERIYRGDPESEEQARVRGIYQGYRASPRKRSRWTTENPGNAAIRGELVAGVRELASQELAFARDLLDVGCGSGWWLETLATDQSIGASLTGVDLLEERVATARHRVPLAQIEVGDARSLSFPDGAFDIVTMFTVLSSLRTSRDVRAAVREAARVTRPGGALVIWEPRITNPLNPHTRLIRRQDLVSELPGAWLCQRSTTVLPGLARRLGRHTSRLYPELARVPALRTHRLMILKMPGQTG